MAASRQIACNGVVLTDSERILADTDIENSQRPYVELRPLVATLASSQEDSNLSGKIHSSDPTAEHPRRRDRVFKLGIGAGTEETL